MATLHARLFRFFWIVVLALLTLVIVSVCWQLVEIQFRLSRNGKIARQLVESLQVQFPGIEFRGAASYESEVIYLTVFNRLDEAERREIEKWLGQQKVEQRIAPRIWLRIAEDEDDKRIIIK